MKLSNAIRILEEQKQKILNKDIPNSQEWTIQTASFIKDFFGFESPEYSRIAQFKWYVKTTSDMSDEDISKQLKSKKDGILLFMDNCIESLSHKGLYKMPKTNLISDKANLFLVIASFTLLSIGFSIGYWVREFEVFSKDKNNFIENQEVNTNSLEEVEKE